MIHTFASVVPFDSSLSTWQWVALFIEYTIKIVAIGWVPAGRKPSSSSAWLLAILLIPLIGLPLFLLMGSPYINGRRHRIQREANEVIQDVQADLPDVPAPVSPELASIIHLNRVLTGMPAVVGWNQGLHSDYEQSIQAMADAVDAAENYVYVEIYIVAWDHTTDVFFSALQRAAARGVDVRLLFDQVGSWKYPGYRKLGRRLTQAGVNWRMMLPLAPWKWRFRRPDLRNHRKLLVVDGQRAFMGSQNMIDSSYLLRKNVKEGTHWVDVMAELGGPIVSSLEMVFAMDWLMETDELVEIVPSANDIALDSSPGANILQLVPSGPGYSTEPNLRMFVSLVHHTKERLILCSPYFIPDESLLEAITTACYRGVRIDLLVNEQSDQFVVGHAQSSYYQSLLEAGVHIHLYPAPAVLHSKFLVCDPGPDAIAVMGSSNMDMRSFGLNYEISMMNSSGDLKNQLTDLAKQYMDVSRELSLEEWKQRGLFRRYVDNAMRLTSALQ